MNLTILKNILNEFKIKVKINFIYLIIDWRFIGEIFLESKFGG